MSSGCCRRKRQSTKAGWAVLVTVGMRLNPFFYVAQNHNQSLQLLNLSLSLSPYNRYLRLFC